MISDHNSIVTKQKNLKKYPLRGYSRRVQRTQQTRRSCTLAIALQLQRPSSTTPGPTLSPPENQNTKTDTQTDKRTTSRPPDGWFTVFCKHNHRRLPILQCTYTVSLEERVFIASIEVYVVIAIYIRDLIKIAWPQS